jgi:tetratricopeptide (TPR) repeat protein
MKRCFLSLGVCLMMFGCATTDPKPAGNRAAVPSDPLAQAQTLEQRGDDEQAFIGYRSVLNDPANPSAAKVAQLGAARCLIAMERYVPALVMLEPMPERVSGGFDRRRLALGAEAMLRLGVPAHAESLAEVALADLPPGQQTNPWVAACRANLAKAYLENDKPAKAAAMYRAASESFRSINRPGSAAECLALALEIEKALADSEPQGQNRQ